MRNAVMRLSGDCPDCGGVLVRRENLKNQSVFIGCRNYPRCRFTDTWDEQLADLIESMAELRADVDSLRDQLRTKPGKVDVTDLKKKLREVIAFAHPDRHPTAVELAHGVVSKLNAIRDRLA